MADALDGLPPLPPGFTLETIDRAALQDRTGRVQTGLPSDQHQDIIDKGGAGQRGFVTDRGRFVGREEGASLHEAATGQTVPQGQLHSEDLPAVQGGLPPLPPGYRLVTPMDKARTELSRLSQGPTPELSMARALFEGGLTGASANLRDELLAASQASGLPEWLGGFRAPVGAARLGYEAVTEPGKASSRYAASLQNIRRLQEGLQKKYPKTYLASELAGGFALPMGAAAQGATLPARAGRAALTGLGYGALSGFGAGRSPTERAIGGAIGGAAGGVIGGAAAPATELAVRAVSKPAAAIASRVRGVVAPEREAARRVATAVQRDVAADPLAKTRLTPEEYATTPQARVLDLGGDLTRRLADVSAMASPEAKTTILNVLDERAKGQTPRIMDWFAQTFGSPSAFQLEEALGRAAQGTNRAAYQKAMMEGATGIGSPELERLAGSKTVSKAMQAAMHMAEDEAIVSGYGAMNPRITFTPDGRVQFSRSPQGMPAYPDLQFWDFTRRMLSSQMKQAQKAGHDTEARQLQYFTKRLNAELDKAVPSYKTAREGAAAFFGSENALEAGQKFVTMKSHLLPEATQAFGKMSDSEKYLFRQGFVSRMLNLLKDHSDRRSAISKIYGSPAAKEKIEVALGSDKSRELEALLRVEGIMDLARQRVTGSSWTAQRLVDLGLLGGAAGIGGTGIYQEDPKKMAGAAVLAALTTGGRKIDERILRRVADALISNDPTLQQRGLSYIARSDRLMNRLRSVDRRITTTAAQQAAKVKKQREKPQHYLAE